MEQEAIYLRVLTDLKKRINQQEFATLKLPDERSLAVAYDVSRSSIKRALNVLAQQGIIFKKRGSGTFVNPLYLKNQNMFQSTGHSLGVSDSFRIDGEAPAIELVSFDKQLADKDTQLALFLEEGEEVYHIKRLRQLQGKTFMSEDALVPVKLLPNLTEADVHASLFKYAELTTRKPVTRSFLTVSAEPSTPQDQRALGLKSTEPVGVMAGIYFLDDGTPFEVGTMRIHYKYMRYNSFDSLDGE
ncbi:GntR family transcriptional regulator [Weissella viridescens]|jgi:DNA-binding GntR family transcriptional regulator|uniref:GntR family transcriptional regulator n=1 Tax=Weissella viridescens TaxID=1629 RepID=A0A0R2H3Z0_WEIVI|nr:GntR family transcriptional regulator [Weissella viridescens]KRN46358.1 GntR family transcriptional regulator [Weissella viridescens]MBX4173122.1 GntR family transcriptional regulator [Weissella viridescens]MCB6840741.1 GntR family transcriptional regulator [Weissella viridescens]MCB6847474.1 GntR family transcriptional regulator [Weissella viridescens]QOD86133.1 GntR family transcriptional regulator [Weissella viridescens]